MRRAVFLALVLLVTLPGAAWALRLVPGDGTLAVRNGDGLLMMEMTRGAAIGKVAQGRLTVDVLEDETCASLPVFGENRVISATRERGEVPICIFIGKGLRFRFVGRDIRFVIFGEFSLSMVARGKGAIRGRGGADDGTYSLDGADYASLPDDGVRRFVLGPPSTLP